MSNLKTIFAKSNPFGFRVLLSPDAKLIAYLLLTLRLTFQLDNAQCALQDDQYFDVDSWIHQLEMRIKCWQGHNMSLVMRSSLVLVFMKYIVINLSFVIKKKTEKFG